MTRPMRRSLPLLALLLAGCAPSSPSQYAPHDVRWEEIGSRVYRMDDHERGVTCYMAYFATSASAGISCVRTSTPTLEAEK